MTTGSDLGEVDWDAATDVWMGECAEDFFDARRTYDWLALIADRAKVECPEAGHLLDMKLVFRGWPRP